MNEPAKVQANAEFYQPGIPMSPVLEGKPEAVEAYCKKVTVHFLYSLHAIARRIDEEGIEYAPSDILARLDHLLPLISDQISGQLGRRREARRIGDRNERLKALNQTQE